MSYCRWSSNNWDCDLYCYGSAQGFTTHVASNRIDGDIPKEDWQLLHDGKTEEFMVQHNAQMKFLDTCTRSPIGLPFDGQSFDDPDEEAFLARLMQLREAGYRFPDYVIDSVREEIEELRGDAAPMPPKEK